MGEKMSDYNKPIDRDYFKKKENPKWNAEKKVTPCCEQPIDEDFLFVNNKEHWEMIEEHIRQYLHDYSKTESVTPVSCEVCHRLLEYTTTLSENAHTPGYLRK